MDGSRGRRAISSDEDALFSFCFHFIYLRCPGIDVSKNNQDKVDAEKADKANGADKADGTDRTNKEDGVDGADRVDAKELDGADRGGVEVEEPDRTNRGRADGEKPDGPSTAVKNPGLGDS